MSRAQQARYRLGGGIAEALAVGRGHLKSGRALIGLGGDLEFLKGYGIVELRVLALETATCSTVGW